MMACTVSVVIPVYNGEDFIVGAIESVQGQPFDDLEIVVTDNESTDSTFDLVEKLAAVDNRISIRRNERNLGPFGNSRRGLDHSRGRFVKWMAADDRLHPDFLTEAVSILEHHHSAALVVGRMIPVGPDRVPLPYDPEVGMYRAERELVRCLVFPEAAASDRPSERFAALVADVSHNLIAEFNFGLFRGSVLRSVRPFDRLYLGAEKAYLARLLLRGRALRSDSPSSERTYHATHFGGRTFADAVAGIDPDFSGRFAMPVSRELADYLRAIATAPVTWGERTRCVAVLFRKVAQAETLAKLFRPGPDNYFGWGR